jgi:hypothetical protein
VLLTMVGLLIRVARQASERTAEASGAWSSNPFGSSDTDFAE